MYCVLNALTLWTLVHASSCSVTNKCVDHNASRCMPMFAALVTI